VSVRYKFFDSFSSYFVTFAVVEWVDVFTRDDYRNIFVESVKHCIANKGLIVHGWVLMTNHVHMLISLQQNGVGSSLSDVMRDMKKFTAMQIIKSIKENRQESRREWMMAIFESAGRRNSNNTMYQFWQQDNHPIAVKDYAHYSKMLEYIHENAVVAGFVNTATAYPWSSAEDYANGQGKIPISIL
jgi:REP element-mobilizing transposase RayT